MQTLERGVTVAPFGVVPHPDDPREFPLAVAITHLRENEQPGLLFVSLPYSSRVNTRARVVRADRPLTSVYKEFLAGVRSDIRLLAQSRSTARLLSTARIRGGNFERHPTTRNQPSLSFSLCLLYATNTSSDIRLHDRPFNALPLSLFIYLFHSLPLFLFFIFFFFFSLVAQSTESCVGYKLYLEGGGGMLRIWAIL